MIVRAIYRERQPSRLRWRLANLVDKLPGQCWADLVGWVYGDRGRLPWQPIGPGCRRDVARLGSCYCGKLRDPGGESS